MIRPTIHVSSSKSDFARIANSLSADVGKHVNVGLVGPKAQEQHGDSGLTNLELGIVHEYGTATVPARPFIRQSIVGDPRIVKGIGIIAKQGLKQVIAGKASKVRILQLIGKFAAGGMRTYLLHGPHIQPELSPSTVHRKSMSGAADPDRPLVDTEQLARAISWQLGDPTEWEFTGE